MHQRGTLRETLVRTHDVAVLASVWLRTSETEISAEVRQVVAY